MKKAKSRKNHDIHKGMPINAKADNAGPNSIDEDMRLAVIGEFSSGKSSMINAILRTDVLNCDVLQGTTIVPTLMHFSQKPSLQVVKKSFRDQPKSYSINDVKQLRNILSTFSEADAASIDYFDIGYPSQFLSNGISIVDTPGTNSLESWHEETAIRAAKGMADALIVVINADKPLPDTLVNFLNANFENMLSTCMFVVTKLDLVRDHGIGMTKNRIRQIEWIKGQLHNKLGLEHPILLPYIPPLIINDYSDEIGTRLTLSPEDQQALLRISNVSEERIMLYIRLMRRWVLLRRNIQRLQPEKNDQGIEVMNPQAEKKYLEYLSTLLNQTNDSTVDEKYMWDLTASRYASSIQRVQKALDMHCIKDNITDNMQKNLQRILERCADKEFHIALVGVIKAGKSTLLNALLGCDVASVDVTPETAALSKYRRSDTLNYVKISFYGAEEWERVWASVQEVEIPENSVHDLDSASRKVFMDEYKECNAESMKDQWIGVPAITEECESMEDLRRTIAMYTSSRSPRHYFVKEVVVGLNNINLPQNIVLVDTPGLNDIVSYRSNITKQYIERANAVIVCINAENFDTNALQTLYGVFGNVGSHVEKVITLGTKIDIFDTPLESWEKHKANWIKYLSSADCYGSIQLAKQNIMHVSAKSCILLNKYDELFSIAGSSEESYDPTNLNAVLSPAQSAQRGKLVWELAGLLTKWEILSDKTIDPHKTMYREDCSIYDFVMRFSNIPMLLQIIDERLVKRYKELLIEELSEQYSVIRNEISDTMRKICSEKELIIRSSEAGIHEIISKREDYAKLINDAKSDEKELPKILENIKQQIQANRYDLQTAFSSLRSGNA